MLQFLHGFYIGSAFPTVPTQFLHPWTASDEKLPRKCLLENGSQTKKLNFLVFCHNAGPTLPNKTCDPMRKVASSRPCPWTLKVFPGGFNSWTASDEKVPHNCLLENGSQTKKLNFLVFCHNAGPP